ARWLVRRRRGGGHCRRRRGGLRVGTPRVGGRLPATVAWLLEQVLGTLQRAVRRECGGAAQWGTSALFAYGGAGSHDIGRGRHAARAKTRRREQGSGAGVADEFGTVAGDRADCSAGVVAQRG